MNSRNAWFWAFTAAILLLALVGYERLFRRPEVGPRPLLPGFRAAQVDAIRVLPAGTGEIQVERTNGTWVVTRPLRYPGQANLIEALLSTLEQMVPATTISGADLRRPTEKEDPYGMDTPRASLVFSIDGGQLQLLIGSVTAPGDQVFVKPVGGDGVSVVDISLLRLIPASVALWRDTGLFELADSAYDTIQVTAGERVLELTRDAAQSSWRIVRPMQARADAARVQRLIQGLRDLTVRGFISDDPRADFESWGLQPPELTIAFAAGTNRVQTLQFGKPVESLTNAVYAIGREPSSVVVVAADPLQPWKAAPNDFRDPKLLRFPQGVQSIEVTNGAGFKLVHLPGDGWRIEPAGMTAETATVERFLAVLQGLRISRFVKDVVAEPDLPEYGLASPSLRIVLEIAPAQDGQPPASLGLEFGSERDGSVFVRRLDENAVYAVALTSLEALPAAAGHFRELRLWEFPEAEVSSLTAQKGDVTWQLTRSGPNQWSLAPGSQGIINAFAVEELVHRLRELEAVVWTDWDADDLSRYGLGDDSIRLTLTMEDGRQRSVRFGYPAPSGHVYAATTLEGGTWVFEFPGDVFDLVRSFVINPSGLR